MELRLTGKLYHHKRWVVARCPELDIASQGEDEAEARRMLAEAVQILLQEMARKETLKDVLREAQLPVPDYGEPVKAMLDFGRGIRILVKAKL